METLLPLVSVIIPAYNSEPFIGKCLGSVCGQTLSDIEIIVVDDGSTDATAAMALECAASDRRIKVIQQDNLYAGVARNNGMKVASGDYLYFLDSDDYIEPNCLELMVQSAELTSSDVVVCRSASIDNVTGEHSLLGYACNGVDYRVGFRPKDISSHIFQSFVGWPWDKLFKAEYVRELNLEYQPLRTTNDALFVFLALLEAESIVCVDNVLVHHRVNNSDSLENTRSKSWKCAVDASRSIRGELVARGLLADYEISFTRWLSYFLRWNFVTIDPSLSSEFLNYAEDVLATLPQDAALLDGPREVAFVRSLHSERGDLLRFANDAYGRAFELEQSIGRLENDKGALSARVETLEKEIVALNERLENLSNSESFKVGSALVRPLSVLKRRFGR